LFRIDKEKAFQQYHPQRFTAAAEQCWFPLMMPYPMANQLHRLKNTLQTAQWEDHALGYYRASWLPGTPWGFLLQVDPQPEWYRMAAHYRRMAGFLVIAALCCGILFSLYIRRYIEESSRQLVKLSSKHRVFKERVQLMFDVVGEGVIYADKLGYIQYMNLAAESISGYRLYQAKGKKLAEVFPLCYKETGQSVWDNQYVKNGTGPDKWL
jgi:PAS domain-containing protein